MPDPGMELKVLENPRRSEETLGLTCRGFGEQRRNRVWESSLLCRRKGQEAHWGSEHFCDVGGRRKEAVVCVPPSPPPGPDTWVGSSGKGTVGFVPNWERKLRSGPPSLDLCTPALPLEGWLEEVLHEEAW